MTVVAIGALLYWSSLPCYRLLYANMPLEDAAKAQEKLEEKRILVKLSESGHALYVPAADVYRSRLLLAADGLPKNNNVGFEMFAEPKFGLTDFAQQVNYQRALQGELQNTIMAMDGITSARVLLVLPKGKLFSSEEESHSTASVIVNVPQPLSAEQVRSLTHLVAAGVPGLRVTDITITDQNGRLLSRGGGSSADGENSGDAGNQMEIRAKIEEQLAHKGQRMLDLALGLNRSTVQVSADLDFSRMETERETLNSEGRVVTSESISSESSTTPSAENHAAGYSANVPVSAPAPATRTRPRRKRKTSIPSTRFLAAWSGSMRPAPASAASRFRSASQRTSSRGPRRLATSSSAWLAPRSAWCRAIRARTRSPWSKCPSRSPRPSRAPTGATRSGRRAATQARSSWSAWCWPPCSSCAAAPWPAWILRAARSACRCAT